MKNFTRILLQLLLLVMSLVAMNSAQAAFTINNDGTVTDPKTGLTWMRCAMGELWNGQTCTGKRSTYTFDKANALTGTVNFAGKSDWRVPNIRELQTIVDRSVYNPAFDSTTFPYPTSGFYFPSDFWSSSPYTGSSSYAWNVDFYHGKVNYKGVRSNSYAVWLVRGGQSFGPLLGITRPTNDYVDNGNGTVTHTPTNLTWKRCAQGQTWTGSTCSGTASTFTFDQANALTGTTTFAGQSDWRVPTEDELVSLVDYSIADPGPTINGSVFPTIPNSYFWSSSPDAASSLYAWSVDFSFSILNDNNAVFNYLSLKSAVRLVRGGQSSGNIPVCTLSANPASVAAGNTSTLTANCSPAASSYTWTGGTCAGITGGTCTIAPTTTTSYTVIGTNAGGTGTAAIATVTVNTCTYGLGTSSSSVAAIASTGSISVSTSCAWTAVSNTSWLTITSSTSGSGNGSVVYTVAENTSISARTGTLTISGQTFTVTQAGSTGSVPVCTLSANPPGITVGGSSTLTATCNPAATSYLWAGGTCAGTSAATCTVTPTSTITYSVAGINGSGVGTAASTTVTANTCSYFLTSDGTAVNAAASTGSVFVVVPSSCAWTATSNASWLTITSAASGKGNSTVTYAVAANTGTTTRTGTLTIGDKTYTVTQAAGSTVTAPVCTMSANPASITAGGSSTLAVTCTPAATSYIWTGGGCAGTSGASCTVRPTATTTYSVQGSNAGGTNQAAGATVTVTANTASYTVPGTLGNDVFVLTAGNNYYGGAGNDTFIISPNTLLGGVTAKIVDSEGDNLIQLVDGMTVTASSFYSDAAQLTLSNGAKVQILGASKFKFQLGANVLAGDTAAVLTYSQFVSSLGASLSGTLPASGTAGYVVPTGFTQAAAPVPSVAGSSYTVPGTIGDDVLAPSGGNNYLGGGGGDTYIISPYTLSGAVTAKIIDTEGGNVIQLVGGVTIASSSFYSNAVQFMLSNGALVQILGASGFSYQLGANAPAGVTATSLTYAQFAAALGASVPTGASAVSGSANFVVP
ncbi:MAG: DUF1566 domain-containing protein [Rhodoferax sp.]|nr:DUF1566 domain-containing protein [Rhodoferax sp.]